MIIRRLGTIFILSCLFAFIFVGKTFAHALPGSQLVFAQKNEQLNLTLTLPVDELVEAAPAFGLFEGLAAPQAIAQERLQKLSDYFLKHMTISREDKALPSTLNQARLKPDQNEHVVAFTSLVLEFQAPLMADLSTSDIRLTYDAVMHEVRNHRAVVHWTSGEGKIKRAANFGYYSKGGAGNKAIKIVTD